MRIASLLRPSLVRVFALPAAAVSVLALLALLRAAPSGPSADHELGQTDFNHATLNFVDARSLFIQQFSIGVAIDSKGRLYVADFGNNRVLAWPSAAGFTDGNPAQLVIGQFDQWSVGCNDGGSPTLQTLCNPTAVALDSSDNLYVSDRMNGRVLIYTQPFLQPGRVTASTTIAVDDPFGLVLDASGHLFVADRNENRVLEFDNPANGTPTLVFGQGASGTNFAGIVCTDGTLAGDVGGVGPDSLCSPLDVKLDSLGNLYVADNLDHRVLEYDTPLNAASGESGAGDVVADRVFGQSGSFTSTSANNGGVTRDSLGGATGLAIDPAGNLYASDGPNNRVLEYNTPLNAGSGELGAGDTSADLVFGQQNSFTTNLNNSGTKAGDIAGIGPDTLWEPIGLTTDSAGDLYVEDGRNNRLLEFNETGTPANEAANRELGQHDLVHGTVNFVEGKSLAFPTGVAVDPQTEAPFHTHPIYVADSGNNRVLAFPDARTFGNGASAIMLFGQSSQFSDFANGPSGTVGSGTLNLTFAGGGTAVDASGNLYVADNSNSRVLIYLDPFGTPNGCISGFAPGCAGDTIADFAIGQPNLNTSGCPGSPTQLSLCDPNALAFDLSGDLYVTDSNRVLEYDAAALPTATGPNQPAAHLVFGQDNVFKQGDCNDVSGGLGPGSLCGVQGVAVDASGDLYVADGKNNRVLIYLNPLGSPGTCHPAADGSGCAGDTIADFVIGQTDFVHNVCGSAGAQTLCGPFGVALDRARGDLFVSDAQYSRVLGFDESRAPTSFNLVASAVFGQNNDFTQSQCNQSAVPTLPTASTLCLPSGIAVDASGNLYVVDSGNGGAHNSRVLGFDGPFIGGQTPTPTPTGTPTATPTVTPTVAPAVSPTFTATPTAGATATAAQTATTAPTAAPSSTPTAAATGSATPAATPSANAAATPTGSATSTPTSIRGGRIAVDPDPIDFGPTGIGISPGPSRRFAIRNTGRGILNGVVEHNSLNFPFGVTPAPPISSFSFSLAGQRSAHYIVQFAPIAPEPASARLEVMSSDPKHPLVDVVVKGTGAGGRLAAKNTFRFPDTRHGRTATETFFIRNKGRGVLSGTIGTLTLPFAITSGRTFNLGPKQPFGITMTFTPSGKGPARQLLAITADPPSTGTVTVEVVGRGK